MSFYDQDLVNEADRQVWPSQWLDFDPPTDPETCDYCERTVCTCCDEEHEMPWEADLEAAIRGEEVW